MNEVDQLLLSNRAWAVEQTFEDPEFFSRTVPTQSPPFLWIGCSDSRVAPEQFTQALPGGLFIHRNVANLVQPEDGNLMAVIEFAVEVLKVEHIVVCGHYGCGGIMATLDGGTSGAVGEWLRHAKDVLDDHADEIERCDTREERANRLVEINVRDQLVHLARTPPVARAFAAGSNLQLHGFVYDLRDGLIKPLMEIDRLTELETVPRPEPVLLAS